MRSRNGGGVTRPLTVLFASDAVWHCTGYGITTNYLCRRMARDGHKVYNYAPGAFHQGMVEVAPNLTVLSSNYGDDRWGNNTLNHHIQWVQPDVVITWLDAQGLGGYGWTEHPLFIYAPVDTWPVPQPEIAIYGRAERIMVPSRWGHRVLADQDIKADYIPCGTNLEAYQINTEGRTRWRNQLRPAIDETTFLIGSVGLNSGSPDRKGYGFEFDVIKQFSERHKDIRVYIHTNAAGDGASLNLYELRKEMGLEDVICFSRPPDALGDTVLFMRDMYNAFDVLLHCGVAEGFGVPVIEAQACGTPVVANSCTAMTELLGTHSYGADPLADMIVHSNTRIALPSVPNLLQKLEAAYEDWKRGINRYEVRKSVLRFNQDEIYDIHWRKLLASVPPPLRIEAGERKLLLATGKEKREGFVHHDREKLWPHIEVTHDLNNFPYPWENDSWDYIEASDIFEHLRANIIEVMDELWRVIAPGGHLFIHTAEAGSWQLNMDPTHTQGFMLNSFDYFDPETRHGEQYSYTEHKWKILRRTEDNGGLVFVLSPRKGIGRMRPKLEMVTA